LTQSRLLPEDDGMAVHVPPLTRPLPPAAAAQQDVVVNRGPTDTYRFSRSLILILLATTLDVANFLDRGNFLKYLLLLVPLVSIALIRLRTPSSHIRIPASTDLVLLVLWPLGIVGTLYGMWFLDTNATALSIFLPMSIAFLYLGTVENMTDAEVRTLLRRLAWVGSVYILLNAFVNTGVLPSILEKNQYRNASLIFMALGIGGSVILRRWLRVVILVALEAFVFMTYPSGTSVLVFITILLTFSMTEPRPSKVRPYVIAFLIGCAVAVVLANFATGITITNKYFSLVGKNNANSSRLQAWGEGLNRFEGSPIIGSAFSRPGVTTVVRPGGRGEFQIPFHNDYIFFLATGGILGLGLLVTWIIATELAVLRRYGYLLETGDSARAALLRALLVGFSVFFVTSAFNPTIMGMSRSASIFAVYGLMMAIRTPRGLPREPT
jgi:O-antigen ligase